MLTSPTWISSEFVNLAWGPAFAIGIDVHVALAVATPGLVITPSDLLEVVWGGMDAHIAPG